MMDDVTTQLWWGYRTMYWPTDELYCGITCVVSTCLMIAGYVIKFMHTRYRRTQIRQDFQGGEESKVGGGNQEEGSQDGEERHLGDNKNSMEERNTNHRGGERPQGGDEHQRWQGHQHQRWYRNTSFLLYMTRAPTEDSSTGVFSFRHVRSSHGNMVQCISISVAEEL